MEGGLEHGGVQHFARQALHVRMREGAHLDPRVGDQPAAIHHAVGGGIGHPGAQQEPVVFQAGVAPAADVPVVVALVAGVVEPVVRLLAARGAAAVDGLPGLAEGQGHRALRDVLQRDQLHPRPVGQPAQVLVIGIGQGQGVELLPHAEDGGHLVLPGRAGAPAEQLAHGQGQPAVVVDEAVAVGRVVDHETVHVVDLVDAVAVVAQRHLAAVPVEDVGVLIHQGVAEPQVADLREDIAVQHALGRPEHGVAGDVGPVDAVQGLGGQVHVVLVKLGREVGQDMVGVGAAHERDDVGSHQLADQRVEPGPGPPRGAALPHFRPLQGHGQGRRDVQVQRGLVDAVDLDGPLVARALVVVHDVVDVAAGLDGLVAVSQESDLGRLAQVVVGILADPLGQHAVLGDVILVAPVVGGDPVVADAVRDVGASADITGAGGAVEATVAGVVLDRKDLEVEVVRDAVPTR